MKMPHADPDAVARFERLCPATAGVAVRPMFGQPAAFVDGNMFLGVFGDAVFVRLSEDDRAIALGLDGAHLFEPMPGRPMREYVVLPVEVLNDAAKAGPWIERSVKYARAIGPTKTKKRGRPSGR